MLRPSRKYWSTTSAPSSSRWKTNDQRTADRCHADFCPPHTHILLLRCGNGDNELGMVTSSTGRESCHAFSQFRLSCKSGDEKQASFSDEFASGVSSYVRREPLEITMRARGGMVIGVADECTPLYAIYILM